MAAKTNEKLFKNKFFWRKQIHVPLKPTFLRDSRFFSFIGSSLYKVTKSIENEQPPPLVG